MIPFFAVYRPKKGPYTGGFEQLLRQDKTLYRMVSGRDDAPVTCFEGVFPDWAYDYVSDGGVAVVSGADKWTFSFDAGFLCKAGIEWIDLSFCNQGKARVSTGVSVFAGEGKGELTLHEFRNIKNNRRPGFYPIFLEKQYGKGCIIYTGVPMTDILTYEGSTLRNTSELLDLDERISSVDKQKVGAALREILKDAMHKAGLPYVSLWYFPDGAKSVFAYSIDGDGLLTEGVNNLIEVSEETGAKFLFYINKELCGDDPEIKEKLEAIAKTNILGSHAYIHNAHDSYEDNIKDIEAHEEWMHSYGVDFVKSFASPRGMYCANLGKALMDKGFRHTRDFGYSIDDYPYYPMTEGEQQAPLQISSDGFNVCRWMIRNRDEGMPMPTADEIFEAYKKLMDLKLERRLPMLFFCHPQYFGLYSKEVYPKMVEYAKSIGAMITDYIAYGDFWIERDGAEYTADVKDGKLSVSFSNKPESVRFCVDGEICDPGDLDFTVDCK